nr:uncharacterized protein C8orf58 homolog isoform X3 [Kogia breviceps]
MLGRRRVFAVEPLGGRDGAGEDLACGCVVPGVTSTYRRIPDAAPGWSADPRKGHGRLRAPGRQVPLLKLASQDSRVEMAVGDRSLATSPGLSQDSLNSEPMRSAEPLAPGAMEPPARLSRLLASRKLEQVLERSRQLPTSSASLSQYRSPKPPSNPEYEMPLFGAGGQEATEAESDLEAGLEEAELVRGLGPEAWACLPGQGLRYLEHLCLVLEQMARLQQLCLQLQTQRAPGDPKKEEPALAPSPPPSHAPGSEVHGQQERLSHTEETGEAHLCLCLYLACPGPHRQTPLSSGLDESAFLFLVLGNRILFPKEQEQLHPQRSRSCSTGSGGGALDLLKPLSYLMALPPGLHQGSSLKGLQAKPFRRPLCHH